MRHNQGVELAFVLVSLAVYVGYHLWLFVLLPRVRAKQSSSSNRVIISKVSNDVRTAWTYLSASDKTDSGVPAVQTLRNSIMAASFMATTCGLMATSGVLQVLTDDQRLGQIRKLGDLDPAVDLAGSRGLVRAEWKMAFALFLLLLALLLFVQSIRLYSFLAYYIKVQASDEQFRSVASMNLTLAMNRRCGHCWTAGVRLFYAFIPALLWIMGPVTLLVTTVVVVAVLAISDEITVGHDFSRVIGSRHLPADDQAEK